MSELSVKGFKSIGNSESLRDFISIDFDKEIKRKSLEYFLKKDTAVAISNAIIVYLQRELDSVLKITNEIDLQAINFEEIRKDLKGLSGDDSERKKSSMIELDKRLKAIKNLNISNCKSYSEILKSLEKFYTYQDYTTIVDIKFISPLPYVLIFVFEDEYYFTVHTDFEEDINDFILESGFKDFSFSGVESDDELGVKSNKDLEIELQELKKRERVWKEIYAEVKSAEEIYKDTKKQKVISMMYKVDLFDENFVKELESHKNSQENLKIITELTKYILKDFNNEDFDIKNLKINNDLTTKKGE